MRKMYMIMDEIRDIAEKFVDAVEEAKSEFSIKDRMHRFPKGCCDDATDLFAYFLSERYGIISTRIDGSYYSDDPEENDWHTWLEVEGNVVDLTAYQYNEYSGIYVGRYDEFHKRYEMKRLPYRGFYDLGEGCWDRMQELYDKIIEKM